MKKVLSLILVCAILISVCPAAIAEDGGINVMIYGMPQKFDVMPVMENDRVLVPMRAIFEKLGAKVSWDDETQTVTGTKLNKEVKLTIGDTNAAVDGQTVTLDVPAKIINNRTMVPVRFISEAMGAKVDWNNDTQTVIIERGQTTNIDYNDGRELEPLNYTVPQFADDLIIEGANIRRPVPTQFEKSSDLNDLLYFPSAGDPDEAFAKLSGGEVFVGQKDWEEKATLTGSQFTDYSFVDVEGMPFDRAIRFKTKKVPKFSYECCLQIRSDYQYKKGDVGCLVVYARILDGGHNDTREGECEFTLQETVTGEFNAMVQQRMVFGSEWTKLYVPFEVNNATADKPIRMHIRPAYYIQEIEVGGYELINFGTKYKLSDMPISQYYKGMEEDAEWRKEALSRIEQIRKGDITVTVKDSSGNVIPDANVKLDMYESEFKWGAAIDASILQDTPQHKKYRDLHVKYLNGAVNESFAKWNYYENYPEVMNAVVDWALANGVKNFRGHTLIWDRAYESGNSAVPPDIGKWIESGDYDKIRERMKKHIYEEAGDFAGRISDWDVNNEMTRFDTWMSEKMGMDILKDIFKWAREADPNASLYLCDGPHSAYGKQYEQITGILDWMVQNNVDFDGIALQGHQGYPKDPTLFYDLLDTYMKRYPGKKIQVSEFDILVQGQLIDRNFQANFCRDILIAIYSCGAVDGLWIWGAWDAGNFGRLLFDKDLNLTQSGKVFEDLVYNKWWTRESGKTDANGTYSTRGYFGDYDITVTANGQTKTADVRLYKDSDKNIVITMD